MPVIPVPIGRKSTVTIEGKRLKRVDCQHCQGQFYYIMTMSVTESKTGYLFLKSYNELQESARKEAEAGLQKAFESGDYYIHCPNCGKFQEDMIKNGKMLYTILLILLEIILAIVYTIWTVYWYDIYKVRLEFISAVIAVLLGLGIIYVRYIYDPNRKADKRVGKKDPRILTLEEVKLLTEKQQ